MRSIRLILAAMVIVGAPCARVAAQSDAEVGAAIHREMARPIFAQYSALQVIFKKKSEGNVCLTGSPIEVSSCLKSQIAAKAEVVQYFKELFRRAVLKEPIYEDKFMYYSSLLKLAGITDSEDYVALKTAIERGPPDR